ncbi:hypothetical protein [Actinokineospora sp. NBRC 105648]|uniref:hypothetical protein n=1 Tax=Actinokineospora sp. NBRC 105648 TaxID=3032206 RepID=UPI0024A0557B|nr:hypothetical protein [Actinokineospora sp. NBRC 105648]GLZ38889.1 hypothetical protein Acsp05_25130 [Actinokineospora sp. NBRC 105648]
MPEHRRLLASAALAVVVLTSLGTTAAGAARQPGTAAAGGIGIQLLDAPVNRRDDPRALRYIVDHLPPGTLVDRKVLVANKSGDRQAIDLYPAAATIEDGRFRFGEGHATNELADWISLDHTRVDLGPGKSATLKVTIAVPPTAPPGERYAVLWASTAVDPDSGTAIKQVHRVGIRLYLDIGPGGEPVSSFAIGDLVPMRDDAGVPSVAVHVANTGGRALDLTGAAVLSNGPGMLTAGPFAVSTGTTLGPAQSGTVTVRFPEQLPNGPWTMRVDLASGTAKDSATALITFPAAGSVGEAGSPLTNPWLIASVVALLLAGLYLLRRHGKKKSAERAGSIEPAQPVLNG